MGPLLVFGGKLAEARRRGIIDYGGLAGAVGSQLEKSGLTIAKVSTKAPWTYNIFPLPSISTKLLPTSIK